MTSNNKSPFDYSPFRKWAYEVDQSSTEKKTKITFENCEINDGVCLISFDLRINEYQPMFGHVFLKAKLREVEQIIYSIKINFSSQNYQLKVPVSLLHKYAELIVNNELNLYLLAIIENTESLSKLFKVTVPSSDPNVFYATRILDRIRRGVVGKSFDSDLTLAKIIRGEKVFALDPKKVFVQIFPILDVITAQAEVDGYEKMVVGSFIREPKPEHTKGHPEGRCIDINLRLKGNNESTLNFGKNNADALELVTYILNIIKKARPAIKSEIGFGLPWQDGFLEFNTGVKFHTTPKPKFLNTDLEQLVRSISNNVFPDIDNHLHIQVDKVVFPIGK
ncbi:MAG TPA: hypothetical protein VLL54_14270 [Pyrinomonadaceae bacterium]|nr:hypothetical protein [Pyrinomonadaceae bacterium]